MFLFEEIRFVIFILLKKFYFEAVYKFSSHSSSENLLFSDQIHDFARHVEKCPYVQKYWSCSKRCHWNGTRWWPWTWSRNRFQEVGIIFFFKLHHFFQRTIIIAWRPTRNDQTRRTIPRLTGVTISISIRFNIFILLTVPFCNLRSLHPSCYTLLIFSKLSLFSFVVFLLCSIRRAADKNDVSKKMQ